MLKIIGGEFRSRRLAAPGDTEQTRPYIGRAREAVFNLLRGWFEDANVLDLFSGVGSMGLEAVSRGAKEVLMVEQDRRIADMLKQNIEMLGCGDRAIAMQGDALGPTCLMRAARPLTVVFMDPPYEMMKDEARRGLVMAQAAACVELMAEESFLVLRSPIDPDRIDLAIPGLDGPEVHQYGKTMWVLLYAPPRPDEGKPE